MNSVILTGRLTAKPELKQTRNGVDYVRFSVAVKKWTQENPDAADFIPCKAYRQTAKYLADYADKGRMICVHGSLRTDENAETHQKYYEVVCEKTELFGTARTAEPAEEFYDPFA